MRTIILYFGAVIAAASPVFVANAGAVPGTGAHKLLASSLVSPAGPMPAPDSTIYTPTLPSVAELSSAAKAQGLAIEKIEESGGHVVVEYRHPDGQITTVAYRRLSTAAAAAAPRAAAPVTRAPSSHTTIIYETPPDYFGPYWGPDGDESLWDPDFDYPDWGGAWGGDWGDGDDR